MTTGQVSQHHPSTGRKPGARPQRVGPLLNRAFARSVTWWCGTHYTLKRNVHYNAPTCENGQPRDPGQHRTSTGRTCQRRTRQCPHSLRADTSPTPRADPQWRTARAARRSDGVPKNLAAAMPGVVSQDAGRAEMADRHEEALARPAIPIRRMRRSSGPCRRTRSVLGDRSGRKDACSPRRASRTGRQRHGSHRTPPSTPRG